MLLVQKIILSTLSPYKGIDKGREHRGYALDPTLIHECDPYIVGIFETKAKMLGYYFPAIFSPTSDFIGFILIARKQL